MNVKCPNNPDHLPHEPMLLPSGLIYTPYAPPGTRSIAEIQERERDVYDPNIDAWIRLDETTTVGVCKHCRCVVLFDNPKPNQEIVR